MPFYHRLGSIPPKRHVAFRAPSGELYPEELVGNMGFVGPSSLLYHVHRPTQIRSVRVVGDLTPRAGEDADRPLLHRHFRAARLSAGGSPTTGRTPLLFNQDVTISFAQPEGPDDDFFYRNAQADELVYVSDGGGTLESVMGELPFGRGDYLVIPRGVLHRYRFDAAAGPVKFLVVESAGYVRTPKRYRNEFGQMLEGSPFNERDIRRPEFVEPRDEKGAFRALVKKGNQLVETVLDYHPFDVVGWDGYYYPWAFNIENFEPKVGRTHLPPPVHQTFESDNFVVCSFCPRPYDFDPEAVPAPYNHANIMSDEVIYYASSEFMSRKGIEYGSITLHPDGLIHGPHPGRAEASIGKTWTDELAVMVDTFRPLSVCAQAADVEDPDYSKSWLEDE